jgi:hypothetical protein
MEGGDTISVLLVLVFDGLKDSGQKGHEGEEHLDDSDFIDGIIVCNEDC